jgi:hypothetical protein
MKHFSYLKPLPVKPANTRLFSSRSTVHSLTSWGRPQLCDANRRVRVERCGFCRATRGRTGAGARQVVPEVVVATGEGTDLFFQRPDCRLEKSETRAICSTRSKRAMGGLSVRFGFRAKGRGGLRERLSRRGLECGEEIIDETDPEISVAAALLRQWVSL